MAGVIRRYFWRWMALAAGVLSGGAALLYPAALPAPGKPVMQVPCMNIVTGCMLPGRAGRITFDQQPQAMRSFHLRLEIPLAHGVHASFAMRDMGMGLNRYRLLAEGAGVWAGEVILPVCVHGRSDWVMTLDMDGRLYQLPFASG